MNKFIAFEGIDDAKVAQAIELVCTWLREQSQPFIVTDEYVDSPQFAPVLAASTFSVLQLSAQRQLLTAVREQHLASVVLPALARGTWVLARRYSYGTCWHAADIGNDSGERRPDVICSVASVPEVVWQAHRRANPEGRLLLSQVELLCDRYAQACTRSEVHSVHLTDSDLDDRFAELIDLLGEEQVPSCTLPLFESGAIKRVWGVCASATKEQAGRLNAVLSRLDSMRGSDRNVVQVPRDFSERLLQFEAAFPNFSEVAQYLRQNLVLSVLGDRRVEIPPMMFCGESGIGKTEASLVLCDLLGLPVDRIDMAGLDTAAPLSGSDSSYINAKEGRPFEMLAYGNVINPAVVLEEIDKVSSGPRSDPLGPLYVLLEKSTARQFKDASIPELPFNASHINWIATANDHRLLPGPLLKRFRLFHVPVPNRSQWKIITRNMYGRILKSAHWGRAFKPVLDEVVVEHMAAEVEDTRALRDLLLDALGHAAMRGARSISIGDVQNRPEKRAFGFAPPALRQNAA